MALFTHVAPDSTGHILGPSRFTEADGRQGKVMGGGHSGLLSQLSPGPAKNRIMTVTNNNWVVSSSLSLFSVAGRKQIFQVLMIHVIIGSSRFILTRFHTTMSHSAFFRVWCDSFAIVPSQICSEGHLVKQRTPQKAPCRKQGLRRPLWR